MADLSLSIPYQKLLAEVAYVLGFGMDTATFTPDQYQLADRYVQSGLRMFYQPPALNGQSHQWHFMRPLATIKTTPPFSDGTVTVVSGVVTLDGAVWPSWAGNADIQIENTVFAVETRDSDTQLTLVDKDPDYPAGTAYELRQWTYDLPEDWTGWDGPLTFQPDASNFITSVKIIDENLIRRRRQYESFSNQPMFVATRAKEFDPKVGQRYECLFWPAPDKEYALQYTYKANPNDLSNENPYPLGGAPHAETIRAACLAAVERESDEINGVRMQYFMERLAASVEIDRRENSQMFLGKNRDLSDGVDGRYTGYRDWNEVTDYNNDYLP